MKSANPQLILASSSPRRRRLLSGVGLDFQVIPAGIDEELMDGESPEEHVGRLAVAKAREIALRSPGAWVLGADTIVVINGTILGKPSDKEEANSMLKTISSATHVVYTGYAILNEDFPEKERVRTVRSEVRIRAMTDAEIDAYIETGEPMDKAGSYAIQGVGAAIVDSVDGSYTNVVGLPLCQVMQDLKELGIYDFLSGESR